MKKKFESEEEVIRLIDKYHDDIKDDLCHIEKYNELADALRMTCWAHKISGLRDEIETFHRQIEWRQDRLETLREILAEMRTMELPFKDERNPRADAGNQEAASTLLGDILSNGDESPPQTSDKKVETEES